MAFTADTKFFNLAHQGIYLVLLIFELIGQLIFPGGWYCGLLPPWLLVGLPWLDPPCLHPLPYGIPLENACNLHGDWQNSI